MGRLKGTADAVVKPHSTEQVSSILKWAYAHEIPVTPRGAGTNLVGSTVPDHGGIVLDLSEMNRVLELDEETWQKERTANMKRIYGKAYELGGLTSGEHGIGLTKKQYFLAETPSVNLELMRGIKESFDKKHILNSHISYNIE